MKEKASGGIDRRGFLISATGVAGNALTGWAWAAPCTPPTLSATGGSSTATSCSPTALPALTLTSAAASGTYPWTFGHAFKKGDVPSGQFIQTDAATSQAIVRNRWPDGSVKFAVLSGTAAFTSGAPRIFQLATTTTAPSAPAVTIADLKATNISTAIGFGASTATWSGTDWDTPSQTLASGPVMSSWVYRKAIGGDAHLVAWLEVRCYRSGEVEMLPWIENGFVRVAGPTTKSGRATFSIGGAVRYDSINDPTYTTGYSVTVVSGGTVNIAHHARVALVSGGRHSHWLGTDPQVTPAHNRAYLESTKVVPTYRPTTILSSVLAGLNQHYSPMRVCYLEEGMGAPGYSPDIGMLPNHAAMYIVSGGDMRAYRACIAQGFSLASYCIHYRDENTSRPILFADRPSESINISTVPAPSGSEGYRYASSHHPAAAYLPYLLTGWNWFVEELQFQTTAHYLARNASTRQNANYYFYHSASGPGFNEQGGPRAQAWQWRTCAMAASITPDSDTTMRNQFVGAMNFNANYWRVEHDTGAVGRPWAPNNLGCVAEPGYNGSAQEDGKVVQGSWQDDFMTASVGFTWDLEVITDTARVADLLWFRDFKYRAVVGRLGQQNVPAEWNYRFAAQYQIYIGTPTGNANTFNWYATWGDAFQAEKGQANTGYSGTDLQDGNIGGFGMSQSYWANLQPAIAYAVSHDAPGALAAYNRMVAASNFASTSAEFQSNPGWGIRPNNV